jgi:hypothetical protein
MDELIRGSHAALHVSGGLAYALYWGEFGVKQPGHCDPRTNFDTRLF